MKTQQLPKPAKVQTKAVSDVKPFQWRKDTPVVKKTPPSAKKVEVEKPEIAQVETPVWQEDEDGIGGWTWDDKKWNEYEDSWAKHQSEKIGSFFRELSNKLDELDRERKIELEKLETKLSEVKESDEQTVIQKEIDECTKVSDELSKNLKKLEQEICSDEAEVDVQVELEKEIESLRDQIDQIRIKVEGLQSKKDSKDSKEQKELKRKIKSGLYNKFRDAAIRTVKDLRALKGLTHERSFAPLLNQFLCRRVLRYIGPSSHVWSVFIQSNFFEFLESHIEVKKCLEDPHVREAVEYQEQLDTRIREANDQIKKLEEKLKERRERREFLVAKKEEFKAGATKNFRKLEKKKAEQNESLETIREQVKLLHGPFGCMSASKESFAVHLHQLQAFFSYKPDGSFLTEKDKKVVKLPAHNTFTSDIIANLFPVAYRFVPKDAEERALLEQVDADEFRTKVVQEATVKLPDMEEPPTPKAAKKQVKKRPRQRDESDVQDQEEVKQTKRKLEFTPKSSPTREEEKEDEVYDNEAEPKAMQVDSFDGEN